MAKVKQLITDINTVFYDFDKSNKILIEKSKMTENDISEEDKVKEIKNICGKIYNNSFNVGSLQDKDNERHFHIAFSDYSDFKRSEKDKLIYKIEKVNDNYNILTGLYCGIINFDNKLPQLVIETGYSNNFFKRILNFCCGVYADTKTANSSVEQENIYSLLIQYLFIMSLRKVINKAVPKRYVEVKNRGYDIKGNIDINAFVNNDLLSFDKKISYSYKKQLEIQSIIDVLYTAVKCCNLSDKNKILPDLSRFQTYLKDLYSGIKPSLKIVNNIHKDKCLYNSLYSDFKRPLEYAKILINNNELSIGGDQNIGGISGFLVDASFLWEMYLYNLMLINLPDWYIDSQSAINFYSGTFFRKNNYPDFVLRNKKTNKVFVLDAKFKKMNFNSNDVDNEDIRQLHAYSYYYHLKEEENFMGAGLIYPSKEYLPADKINIDNMYSIVSTNKKFGIFNVKDPDPKKSENVYDCEQIFIKELKKFLGEEN